MEWTIYENRKKTQGYPWVFLGLDGHTREKLKEVLEIGTIEQEKRTGSEYKSRVGEGRREGYGTSESVFYELDP
jgi:hypothetical protein